MTTTMKQSKVRGLKIILALRLQFKSIDEIEGEVEGEVEGGARMDGDVDGVDVEGRLKLLGKKAGRPKNPSQAN